jgi:hypothetical protein
MNEEQLRKEFEQQFGDFSKKTPLWKGNKPPNGNEIADWWIKKIEKLTHCQKLVENGTAICTCKLNCHLHDWRQKDFTRAVLATLKEKIEKLESFASEEYRFTKNPMENTTVYLLKKDAVLSLINDNETIV